MFMLTKEMASVLVKIRGKANLTQKDVAKRMGIISKSGRSYIAQLEGGLIKNPSLATIIDYLNACGGKRLTFFTELDKILIKQEQQEVMSQAELTTKAKMKRVGYKTLIQKLDRDTALYANKIKYMQRPIDKHSLKDRIERKVRMLLLNHKIEKEYVPFYLEYASKFYKREIDDLPIPPIDEKQFVKTGVRQFLFVPIRQIIYKTIKAEKKRLQNTKQYSTEEQKKLAKGFLKYRVIIEQVEFEVHKLLNDLQIKEIFYMAYKDYARACYSVLNKYSDKDPMLLKHKFDSIMEKWAEKGLDEEVMGKIKIVVIRVFKEISVRVNF
jgi:transcriptional regulator with XRE-family HTH domain